MTRRAVSVFAGRIGHHYDHTHRQIRYKGYYVSMRCDGEWPYHFKHRGLADAVGAIGEARPGGRLALWAGAAGVSGPMIGR